MIWECDVKFQIDDVIHADLVQRQLEDFVFKKDINKVLKIIKQSNSNLIDISDVCKNDFLSN